MTSTSDLSRGSAISLHCATRRGFRTSWSPWSVPTVLREPGSGTLAVWQSALASHHLSDDRLHVVAQLGSSESIKQFISSYDAMAILSIRAVRRELWEGRLKLIELKDFALQRLFHIVQRQGQESSLSEDFLRYLHSCENQL